MDSTQPSSKKSLFMKLTALAIFLIFVFQGIILYLILNPINLVNQLTTVQTINEVIKTSKLPPNELPQVGIIGDKKNLQSIEDLKKGNAIDAKIYKDAKDGDYVLGYTSKLVIYRPSEKKVIYDGDTPQQELAKSQQAVVALVQKKALDSKLINDKTPVPQASVVTDPEKVKAANGFYKDVQANDIVANFTSPDLIVVYRPSEDKIVTSGQVSLTVK
jgi:hypothetical protein